MVTRKMGIGIMTVLLLATGLACQLSGGLPGGPSEDTAVDAASEGEGAVAPATTAEEAGSEAPASVVTEAVIVSQPVPFKQGLASLNSYRLSMSTDFAGPTSFDKNFMEMTMTYSADLDATTTEMTNISSSEEVPEAYEDHSQVIQVGNEMCSFSGEGWEYELVEPMVREATGVMGSLMDFTPVIDDPEFIGEADLNGVMSNHFRFRLPGAGGGSGALVTLSDGEYWLAQDGNYLMKYQFTLELRSGPEGDPEAEVVQGQMKYELTDVNQPVSITLPADCQPVEEEPGG